MAYEYKCVGAPEKAKRRRGAKTRSDRVAATMQDIIAAEAVGGWEYLRTDLIPVEEKNGFFSRAHEVHRAVLIFRRGEPEAMQSRPLRADSVSPGPAMVAPVPQAPQPVQPVAAEPEPVAPEPVPQPAPVQQNTPPSEADGDFRLAASRDEPGEPAPVVAQALRAPKGLG
ncbi:MAG: hypothetical protein AAGD13_24605 [Pseudomonadota bacterium]